MMQTIDDIVVTLALMAVVAWLLVLPVMGLLYTIGVLS